MHIETVDRTWDESLYARVSRAFTRFFARRHMRPPVTPMDHILTEGELDLPYTSGRFRGPMRQCEIDQQRAGKARHEITQPTNGAGQVNTRGA